MVASLSGFSTAALPGSMELSAALPFATFCLKSRCFPFPSPAATSLLSPPLGFSAARPETCSRSFAAQELPRAPSGADSVA